MDSVSCQSDHEIDKNVVEGDINENLTALTGDITKEVKMACFQVAFTHCSELQIKEGKWTDFSSFRSTFR